jgi:hypothetical protein
VSSGLICLKATFYLAQKAMPIWELGLAVRMEEEKEDEEEGEAP